MRDPGLSEAIQAAGGVSELARRVGVSQPSVSNWDKVPAERVLVVEAATGVDRSVLRPDLYREQRRRGDVDEIDLARAQEYALLSTLLVRAPDAALLTRLARAARRRDAARRRACRAGRGRRRRPRCERVEREYFDLFIGLGRGELLPYGSYYLTGFLHERPLARLRDDLARFGIERVEGNLEPEDHAAILCEIMAGLAERPLRRRRTAPTAASSRSTWRPGSGASSPIWSAPKRRISTAASARSAACSWTSRRRHSRCRRETARETTRPEEETAMKQNDKRTVGRRDFLRALGAGAGGRGRRRRSRRRRKADSETNDEKRKARYKETDHVKTFYRVNRYPS